LDDDFCESIDCKNYARKENLIGYHEARREFQAWPKMLVLKALGVLRARMRSLLLTISHDGDLK
jgi:hypothetical protein